MVYLSSDTPLGVELGLNSLAVFEAQKAAQAAAMPCQHDIDAKHCTIDWVGSGIPMTAATDRYHCTACDSLFDIPTDPLLILHPPDYYRVTSLDEFDLAADAFYGPRAP